MINFKNVPFTLTCISKFAIKLGPVAEACLDCIIV